MGVCMYVCICDCECVCTYVCVYIYVCVCVCTYMCVCGITWWLFPYRTQGRDAGDAACHSEDRSPGLRPGTVVFDQQRQAICVKCMVGSLGPSLLPPVYHSTVKLRYSGSGRPRHIFSLLLSSRYSQMMNLPRETKGNNLGASAVDVFIINR